MIKRVVGYHAPNNVAFNLYKSLTRSIVEYSAPVWSPQNANETFKKSFFHRIVSEWNSLPIQIKDSTSVNSFKHQHMLHYKLKLQQSFNVNDLCSWTSTCRCQPCVCNRMKNLLL